MFWGELAGRAVGEESGDGDANEGVERVPDEIEGWNLVSEEFDDEEGDAGADNDPALKRLQSSGKWQMTETGEQSQDGDSGVEVDACGKTNGGEEREEFRGRDFQNVEHW